MTTARRAATLLASALLLPAAALAQGAPVTLHKVLFQGNALVPSDELRAALPIQPGQKIDHDGLQADMQAIQAVYQKHNVGASITARMVVFHHDQADVTYVFTERAAPAPTVTHVGITADTVSVTGNKRIKTADILAAAGIRPGDGLTNDRILAAQKAIQALYHKANIGSTISTDWTNAAQPQHVNLVFKIVEKSDDDG